MGTDLAEIPEGMFPGRNGGWLSRTGRKRDEIRSIMREARRENWASLKTLVKIRDDVNEDAEKRIKAALAIVTLSGVTREKPRKQIRRTLSVVRATPEEQVSKVRDATDDSPPATPDPSPPA